MDSRRQRLTRILPVSLVNGLQTENDLALPTAAAMSRRGMSTIEVMIDMLQSVNGHRLATLTSTAGIDTETAKTATAMLGLAIGTMATMSKPLSVIDKGTEAGTADVGTQAHPFRTR